MPELVSVRRVALALALAVTAAACSSSSGDGTATETGTTPVESPSAGCSERAGLSGPIEDRGSAEASGGAITLDASEFAFTPTCVEAGAGGSLTVTVTNGGSALHNLTVESLGIDQDVQAGESMTVEVTLPDAGALPFVCKYHVADGMQGAFVVA